MEFFRDATVMETGTLLYKSLDDAQPPPFQNVKPKAGIELFFSRGG